MTISELKIKMPCDTHLSTYIIPSDKKKQTKQLDLYPVMGLIAKTSFRILIVLL